MFFHTKIFGLLPLLFHFFTFFSFFIQALFSKMASTEYGCHMLLQHGLLSRLAECQFLDFHVDSATAIFQSSMTPSHVNDPFVPSLDERYSKIFSSLAKLVLGFLTQTGLRHKTVITQVRTTSKYTIIF